MKIDAVTVCIDYSDYLEMIIKTNIDVLQRWVIITHESDTKTIKLCERFKLEYIFSKRIYEDQAPFAKSRAINEALQYIQPTDWILHIDSDTLLPADFNGVVNNTNVTDKEAIYGSYRYEPSGKLIVERPWPMTRTWGYFQLWHESKCNDYYETEMVSTKGDWNHDRRFEKCVFLPLHIIDVGNKERGGVNWYGRGPVGKARHIRYGEKR